MISYEMNWPSTSKTLLEKLRSGDEISCEEFYTRYRNIILSLGDAKGLDAAECDELVQLSMLRFFGKAETFRFDPVIACFRTYFGRIIRGILYDLLRRRSRYYGNLSGEAVSENVPADASGPDVALDAILAAEWRKNMQEEALAQLRNRTKPHTFLIFEYHVLKGHSVEEATTQFEATSNQVYKAKERCLVMLREIIAELKRQDSELNWESPYA